VRRRSDVAVDPARLPGIEITAFRRRDLRDVMAVEDVVFPDPWSSRVFTSELALRSGRSYRVLRSGRALAGYFGLMFVDDEAHVTTLAVAPGFQGTGLGTLCMLEAVSIALGQGCRHLSLEVAVSNSRAQSLYRKFGLAPVGVRKGYYPSTGEDALVMWVRDMDTPAYADRLAEIRAALRPR